MPYPRVASQESQRSTSHVRPIFVGGSGRSGTTIMAKVLGRHSQIFSLPVESRFIVDPRGLADLVDAFSTNYTIHGANQALINFVEFALCELTASREWPYRDLRLARYFGRDHYEKTLTDFVGALYATEYDVGTESFMAPGPSVLTRSRNIGRVLSALRQPVRGQPGLNVRLFLRNPRLLKLGWHQPYPVRNWKAYATYYFDRPNLVRMAAETIDSLFREPMLAEHKTIWCEKTPHNHLRFLFLEEMFPHGVFVHMKRHPLGVVWSLMHVQFGPASAETAAVWTRSVAEAWLNNEQRPVHLFEIKVEDFVQEPEKYCNQITSAAGLPPEASIAEIVDPAASKDWRTAMPASDQRTARAVLGDVIERLGYDQEG